MSTCCMSAVHGQKCDCKSKGRHRFTDAEAAERLLNRLNRLVAKHLDDENLHSAEDVLKRSAKRYLEDIIKAEG